jgi:hypothetical protein
MNVLTNKAVSFGTIKKLLLFVLAVPLIGVLAQPIHAQTEEQLTQEIANYALGHTESETRAYVASKIAQMTIQEYWIDFNLSLISGLFDDGSQCIRSKQAICDTEYDIALANITAQNTLLMAGCVLISTANPLAFAACAAAVLIKHGLDLKAASKTHQACLARARLECFPPILGCAFSQLLSWCTDYNFDTCSCDGIIDKSPVIVDVQGNGFQLTDAKDGVRFDITGTGNPELLSWTRAGSDDAFLALDRNGNGLIDNGGELFGNFTLQPAPLDGRERNGFWALTGFDSNGDGKIDKQDPVFSNLRLWQDLNHNGISEPSELHRLDDVGLKSIDLDYKESRRRDQFGNSFRYRAKVYDSDDAKGGKWACDVFLLDK